MTPTTRERITRLDTTLAELDERIARATAKLAPLEQQVQRLARGTVDMTEDAAGAVTEFDAEPTKPGRHVRSKRDTIPTPPPVEQTLTERLEQALRTRPMSAVELAKHLHVPVGGVTAALRSLHRAKKLWNHGSAEMPRWVWVVGDDATPDELGAAVEMLLRDRPVTFAELLAATGARRGRVSGRIVDLQRTGKPVENHGTDRRARWYMPARKR